MSNKLAASLVRQGSQAERLALEKGDVLLSYNAVPIESIATLSNAITEAKENGLDRVKIKISRNEQEFLHELDTGEPMGVVWEEIGYGTSGSNQDVKNAHKTAYGMARGVSSVISLVGWLFVIVGIFVAVYAFINGISSRYDGLSLMALLPGLGTTVSGFLLIMGAQVTKATVDNADHTREILKALKNVL